ncbi:glucose-1-phosphate cytidylyltransferase [Thermodesulfobacterium hydrogeniphilum]|uniref:glucose-1-phosphate cytidylyltransferase n=1 Tax=Thermodesulfobacterium hydrogeniphilum TaxID=161156 RepID=UPI000571565A|nr:glucose-1-phosphate cytidylyltransferase [Thermodesulfobacterium hydrogeniphilum]
MKAVILAGGKGTRLMEETVVKPKPMVEIGGKPILWHIMKIYSVYGINEFIICVGYKGYMIKEYFANYFLHNSDLTVDLKNNSITYHSSKAEPWKITIVDTGENTQTGGRLKRVAKYLKNENIFCFTYGDGLTDANIAEEIKFHKTHGKLATILAVQPPGRFGALKIEGESVIDFIEKPPGDGGWINGGFFVLSTKVLDLIEGDDTPWEAEPLKKLAEMGELVAFKHTEFWHPMDTLRDKLYLEKLWASGKAPWKVWKD